MDPSRGPKRARANDYPSAGHPMPPTYNHGDYNNYNGFNDFNSHGSHGSHMHADPSASQYHPSAPYADPHPPNNQSRPNASRGPSSPPTMGSTGSITARMPPSASAHPSSALPQPPSDDFSAVVKSKLQSYTRTGQACDRCKVRKIRCDALPEGCSHCLGQNLECFVTDRITGRTERRGYLQDLEREKTAMAKHIKRLEELLQDQAGAEVLPWKWSPFKPTCPPGVTLDSEGNIVQDEADEADDGGDDHVPWERAGTVWWKPGLGGIKPKTDSSRPRPSGDTNESPSSKSTTTKASSSASALLYLASSDNDLQSRPIDNYLGVFADRAPLNSVNGTQVSILGTLLDIDASGADLEPEPSVIYHEPTGLYNRSLGSFLRSSMNVNPPLNVDLPSRSDAFEYSEWFFLMLHPFVPILHKPSYMALLTSIYDEPKFTPSISQLATVHMVFATIYFQYGVRNRDQVDRQIHLHDLSNKHYHWALSKFYHIYSDRSVAAVQALVLITLYTRAFPKPGCGSTIASFAVMKAIDLGLHRKSDIPESRTTLENEMRKRAWWNALMLSVTLNGRLGRPMPIRAEDFDTEVPVAISDEYLTEDGITDPSMIGKTPFLVAIHAIKFTTLYMDMFSYLYGARRDPRRYGPIVRQLEAQYNDIQAKLPQELQVESCKPTHLMYALYAHAVSLEFMLCLHHPSACMTSDPQVFAENTRICEETARKLLRHVQKLLELKSLDTTWYQMSVYCAAMFSTLAAAWERRHKATASDIEQLQDETSSWLSIIAEISMLAGASDNGQPFNSKLTQICARTIFGILRDMPPAARKVVMANNALLTPNISGKKRKAALSAARRVIISTNGATNTGTIGSTDTTGSAGNSGSHRPGSGGADGSGHSGHDEYGSYGSYGGTTGNGSISSADGTNSGSGTPSTRYSPGNVDSVALHLETQARMMLDSRREPQAQAQAQTQSSIMPSAMPSAAPATSAVSTASSSGPQISPVQHHNSASQSQYPVGATSYAQDVPPIQNVQNVQNMQQIQQVYTHHPQHHLDMTSSLNGFSHSPQQHHQQHLHQHHQHQQQAMMYSTAPSVSTSLAPAAPDQVIVPPNDMAAAAVAAVAAVNPWTNWTSSINDTQSHDQFSSANALLDLSMLHHRLAPGLSTAGPPGNGTDSSGADAVTAAAVSHMVNRGGGVPTHQVGGVGSVAQVGGMHISQQAEIDSHSAQWPLILFNDNVSGV
ncbi:transcription factor [Ophiostoma piceae UAMH 11346]|uniref:Transcription factor n=1 Tax=Ophiostoma piceae (strain UAMH 11346) TaxID=1262450 RepID=S3D8M3_OPHP1|nr:transcription factor [Ophiostoma piceae UAMH 11346]